MTIEPWEGQADVAPGLISNEALIRLGAELQPILYLYASQPGLPLAFNARQVQALLGYDARSDWEQEIERIVHPADTERVIELTSHATAEPRPDIIRLKHEQGHYCSFSCRAMPRCEGILLIAELQDSGEAVDEVQLLANTITELQRSNKELESFAYIASHDLQEPLRKISTFAGRLTEKFQGEDVYNEVQQYLSRITSSAETMRQLINNLLAYSRISNNAEPGTRVDLQLVLEDVETDLELVIEETDTVILSEKLPVIHGRYPQLKQVFHNIIANAIKFRKQGVRPEISITTGVLIQGNDPMHQIQICDNGIGFDNDYSERIFQIFQRLHGKSEYPGSGIGLAICRKIVELHNGSISARSKEGEGACFTILLPQLPVLETIQATNPPSLS